MWRKDRVRVITDNLLIHFVSKGLRWQRKKRTDPMAKKNEKVAALLSIYCDSVARAPRGPAPPLQGCRFKVRDMRLG